MNASLNLVSDLALIFISAGIVTLVCKWLKQPLILGYIVAGFLIGPHLGIFPKISSTVAVEQWSQLGIIFLLFALGLEFSFKKLMKVGSSALITAGTIFIGMFAIGLIFGKALHWSNTEAIFLGGMLSMSSTTIIIKAFDDLGLKNKPFAGIVFGTLVVEDLMAVLMMVLLSTFAVSQQFAGGEMVMGLVKMAFFLILWFLVGIYVIPSFLRSVHKYLNDEVTLVIAVGMCFGMVSIASYVGFSSALGAFVMGSILAETVESERITKLIAPIKNLFGAIFFISVGMMVDPAVIAQYWRPVIVLSVLAIAGIAFFATSGVLISGQPLSIAVHSGFSMAQLGEFAFIIASLGVSLGVLRSYIYPIIVAVSVITIFATPLLIHLADPVSDYLSKHLPKHFLDRIEANARASHNTASTNEWKSLVQKYIVRILLYSVMLFAITFASSKYFYPLTFEWLMGENGVLLKYGPVYFSPEVIKWSCLLITLAVMSPFLYGLAVIKGNFSEEYRKLWSGRRSNRGILIALVLFRTIVAVSFFVAIFVLYFKMAWWTYLILAFGACAFLLLARSSILKFEFLERRFKQNYNEKEELERRRMPITTSVRSKLSGHDIKLHNITVSPNSKYIGQTLREIPFRSKYGVNIAKIVRGSRIINIPPAEEHIYPYDTILAIGTQSQIDAFAAVMQADTPFSATGYDFRPEMSNDPDPVTVESYTLTEKSYLTSKSLKRANMRDYGVMLIGLERSGESIMNPSPDLAFQAGDTVYLVGKKCDCDWYCL